MDKIPMNLNVHRNDLLPAWLRDYLHQHRRDPENVFRRQGYYYPAMHSYTLIL